MSQYKITTIQTVESDDLDLDDIIAHFDNQADPGVEIEVDVLEPEGDQEDVGTMRIIESDATGEVTEY